MDLKWCPISQVKLSSPIFIFHFFLKIVLKYYIYICLFIVIFKASYFLYLYLNVFKNSFIFNCFLIHLDLLNYWNFFKATYVFMFVSKCVDKFTYM